MAKIAVAPLVGAWIEITLNIWILALLRVAPLVGAWIEIIDINDFVKLAHGRSPRGSVD